MRRWRTGGARQRAKIAGLERYSTGLPCKNGHLDERLTRNGNCRTCVRERERVRRAESGGLKYFDKNPCRAGHISERYVLGRRCIECERIRSSAAHYVNHVVKLEKKRTYRKENLAACKAAQRRWAQKPDVKSRRRAKESAVRKTPRGSLDNRMGSRVWRCLKRAKGGRKWESLVGYSLTELKLHIERQFLPRMTWENMGKWHVDHVIPLASFSYTSPDDPDFKAAWAITNLRPLWAKKNMQKSARRTHLI